MRIGDRNGPATRFRGDLLGKGISVQEWLTCSRTVEDARHRLFCFPYAGGSAGIYKTWGDEVGLTVEVHAAQLPGRPGRMNESPIDDVDAVAEALVEEIEPLADVPISLYGHSMGALVAFEIARRLESEYRLVPRNLFVAARRAPHIVSRNQTLHLQSDERVRSFLRELRAFPADVLDNNEVMELLLPALRADLKLDGMYEYTPGAGVACPVIAFTGEEDEYVLADEIAGWSMHAGGGFELVRIPGDHFFMDHAVHRRPLLARIKRELAEAR